LNGTRAVSVTVVAKPTCALFNVAGVNAGGGGAGTNAPGRTVSGKPTASSGGAALALAGFELEVRSSDRS
jgi:hypothetical protein